MLNPYRMSGMPTTVIRLNRPKLIFSYGVSSIKLTSVGVTVVSPMFLIDPVGVIPVFAGVFLTVFLESIETENSPSFFSGPLTKGDREDVVEFRTLPFWSILKVE